MTMKIQIFLLTALLGFAAGKSPELDPASFDEVIHSKNAFVKFYAPVSERLFGSALGALGLQFLVECLEARLYSIF